MLNDVARWEPVRFSDLAVGVRLQPGESHSGGGLMAMTCDAPAVLALIEKSSRRLRDVDDETLLGVAGCWTQTATE